MIIGMNSSILLEALIRNVPIILPTYWSNRPNKLLKYKACFIANNRYELADSCISYKRSENSRKWFE